MIGKEIEKPLKINFLYFTIWTTLGLTTAPLSIVQEAMLLYPAAVSGPYSRENYSSLFFHMAAGKRGQWIEI